MGPIASGRLAVGHRSGVFPVQGPVVRRKAHRDNVVDLVTQAAAATVLDLEAGKVKDAQQAYARPRCPRHRT